MRAQAPISVPLLLAAWVGVTAAQEPAREPAREPAQEPAQEPAREQPAREEPAREQPASARPDGPEERLRALLDQDLEALMRRSPTWATLRGDRRFDAEVGDPGPEAEAEWEAECRARLAAVEAVDEAALSPRARVERALLRHELNQRLTGLRFRERLTEVNSLWGPQVWIPQLAERASFRDRKEREDFAARLEKLPGYLELVIENLRHGLQERLVPPRLALEGAPEQCAAQAALAGDPASHPLFAPFRELPPDDPLRARALRALGEGLLPAFARLGAFLREEYLPGCRTSLAATDRPDGEAYYRWRLSTYTTLELSPQEIHDRGLAEVARIRSEMLVTIGRTDFPRREELQGEALLRAFVEALRQDPRFVHPTPETLLSAYRDLCKRIDAELPRFFRRLPRLPYGVKAMPEFMSASAPAAYYYQGSLENGVPGYFVANVHRLDQRPSYEMVALACHEAVPGHHLQIALAQELTGLHPWRSLLDYTAFVEGWALYAERLGIEMGLYQDAWQEFGRLSCEMWRALRLVVDTGLHALGWTRAQAVEYMLQNSALSRENVEREVDRYVTWPGQACAYKLGELKLRELRARAEAALGERFDLRAFHDELLAEGALPLPVLERRIEAWIAGH